MRRREVEIREVLGRGWTRSDTGEEFPTAVEAQQSVVNEDRLAVAHENRSRITTIHWMVTTSLGARIVRAIT